MLTPLATALSMIMRANEDVPIPITAEMEGPNLMMSLILQSRQRNQKKKRDIISVLGPLPINPLSLVEGL
jgi:hypothetical protein